VGWVGFGGVWGGGGGWGVHAHRAVGYCKHWITAVVPLSTVWAGRAGGRRRGGARGPRSEAGGARHAARADAAARAAVAVQRRHRWWGPVCRRLPLRHWQPLSVSYASALCCVGLLATAPPRRPRSVARRRVAGAFIGGGARRRGPLPCRAPRGHTVTARKDQASARGRGRTSVRGEVPATAARRSSRP